MSGGMRQWLEDKRQRKAVVSRFEEQLSELPEGLAQQIHTVETAALHIYASNGLPTEPGGYVQRGSGSPWEKLPDTLTAKEKWELFNEAPQDAGWRFCDRANIGRTSTIAELRQASTLLLACSELKARLDGRQPTTPQDVETALQLGSAAAWLTGALARSPFGDQVEREAHSPLIFIPLSDAPEDL